MQVHNNKRFPIKDTKIVSIFQRLHGKVAFTNFVIRKRDGQSKQTKNEKTPNYF